VKDITKHFPLDRIDHEELLKFFELRYQTCWRLSPRHLAFPAAERFALKVKVSHGRISNVQAGPALSEESTRDLLEQVNVELSPGGPTECWRDFLFAHRPVKGSYRFQSAPIQILPPPARAPRAPQIIAEHPFLLEFQLAASSLPELQTMRRRRNTFVWARVLNSLINGHIRHAPVRPRGLWSTNIRGGKRSSWQTECYIVPGYRHLVSHPS
jgi:hypothetical protein